MKLNKIKRAILFIYVAISIGISGYLYLNPTTTFKVIPNCRNAITGDRCTEITEDRKAYSYSLLAEVVVLFLLFAGFFLTDKRKTPQKKRIAAEKYEDGVIVQQEDKETDTSDKIDFDEFEGFVPFEEVIDNMKEILGTEIFEIFGLVGYTNSESGYIASDKNDTTSDEETLLKAFFEIYKILYACFSLVAKEEKMDIPSVMDLIYPDLKKTPSWVSNASEVSQSTIHMLFHSFRTNDLNNKAFEDFEKKDYNKGLAKAAESLFLLFLHPSKIFAFKGDMAIYLDTLGWGLFLNQQFLHSATVHTKSIALDPDSDNIAIHLFNRGMALYSMVSPTEIGIDLDDKQLDFKQRNIDLAKADFQKALEKDPSFEQAQEMLESFKAVAEYKINDNMPASSDTVVENMRNIIEYSSTRFYITQKVYEELVINPDAELIINTSPRRGNHPKGFYKLPNKIAKAFIQSKQGTHNWDIHQNFKQDSIPSELISYFKAL